MAIISVSGKINSGKDLVGSIIQWIVANKEFPNLSFKTFQEYEFIEDREISNWKIVKWADKLKDMVCILLSCTREQLEDRVFKETPLGEEWTSYGYANGFWSHSDGNPSHKMMDSIQCDKETYEAERRINWQTAYKRELTPRLLMQLLGTECGRNILHPNVWVTSTLNDYKCIGNIPDSNAKRIQIDETHSKYDNYNDEVYPNWIITDTRFPNEADAVKSRGGINIRIDRPNPKGIINDFENSDINLHTSETALDNYTFDYVIDNNGTIEDLIIKVKEILIKENII